MIVNMRFDIVTIFPGFFDGIFAHGIVRRALKEGLVTVETHDLRAYTHDRHRTVDDRPFGGGEGMVLKPEPLAEALEGLGIGAKRERLRASQPVSRSASQRASSLRRTSQQRMGRLKNKMQVLRLRSPKRLRSG